MRLLTVLFVVSIAIHLGIFSIPFPKKSLEKKEVVPVSIIDYKIKEQKKEQPKNPQQPKPTKKKIDTKDNVKKEHKQANTNFEKEKVDLSKKQDNVKPIPEKPFRPKGADDPIVLPDINVPLTAEEIVPEIAVPDIPKIQVPLENAENQKDIDVSKELSSLNIAKNNMDKRAGISSEIQKETSKIENVSKGNIYNFDIAPSGNRKVVYLPPDPIFALVNDTKVTVRFSIDKAGNTYNIIFISRSSTDVEKLAADYIGRMKFDAIVDNREDFAQITMQFKVQE